MSELAESKIPPIARLPEEWQPVLVASGEPGFRAKQVFRWIHRGGEFDPQLRHRRQRRRGRRGGWLRRRDG